ncbi:MAG: hypothetical protein RI996_617 [Candidatus Parcubacteria bacterium]|jgi:hypothetical protein
MKIKQLSIVIIVVLALGAAGYFMYSFLNTNSTTEQAETQKTNSNNIFGGGSDTQSLPTISESGESIPTTKLASVASSSYFTLKYNIPDEDAAAASEMTRLANAWLVDSGASDIKTPAQAAEIGISKRGCPGFTYDADYAKYASGEYISYLYSAYDFTCGAHGSSFDVGLTYDKKTGKRIQYLDDVYKADIYQYLSTYARAKLPAILKAEGIEVTDIQDMFDEGTTANRENFQTFYFSGNTLYLVFGQYSIGPYVIGSHTLPVQLSLLESYKK